MKKHQAQEPGPEEFHWLRRTEAGGSDKQLEVQGRSTVAWAFSDVQLFSVCLPERVGGTGGMVFEIIYRIFVHLSIYSKVRFFWQALLQSSLLLSVFWMNWVKVSQSVKQSVDFWLFPGKSKHS